MRFGRLGSCGLCACRKVRVFACPCSKNNKHSYCGVVFEGIVIWISAFLPAFYTNRRVLRTSMTVLCWALVAGAALMATSHADFVSYCSSNGQCPTDSFCEPAVYVCRQCLHCDELRREAPAFATSCIKSVVECGPCLEGLVVDQRGDVSQSPCVPPDRPSDGSMPVYAWVILASGILGLVAMVIIIFYVLRRKEFFRISFRTFPATPTWLRSSCTELAASAPEPPPPYNPYSAYNVPDVTYSSPQTDQDSHPFIKRAPPPEPQSAREAAGSQLARVFNPPSYVRIDPQSPIPPLRDEDTEHWPSIHNEDTTPDNWTPDTSTNDDNGNGNPPENAAGGAAAVPKATPSGNASSDLPSLLAAARDTTLVVPPAKKLKTQQDSNNNGNADSSSNDKGACPLSSSTSCKSTTLSYKPPPLP